MPEPSSQDICISVRIRAAPLAGYFTGHRKRVKREQVRCRGASHPSLYTGACNERSAASTVLVDETESKYWRRGTGVDGEDGGDV